MNDAPPQSTLPEPVVVAGPPGGPIDPQYVYGESAPAEAPTEQPEAQAEAPAPQVGPANPMGDVTDQEIDTTLDGQGDWIDTDDYGAVWRPDATVVGVGFTPYETAGTWEYSDNGWAFASDWDWGWLAFHFGRWAWFDDYWAWVPDYSWGPSWCEWRHGNGVVGWRPMAPIIRDHRHHPGRGVINPNVRDHRHAGQHDMHWRFAAETDLGKPHIHAHVINNLSENLRATATVAQPPPRGTAVAATDLMRGRFARANQPSRPTYNQPSRGYTYNQPSRGTTYNQPSRGYYQQPSRGYYQQPSRGYYQQPPRGTQGYYQQPSRGTTYNPPSRSYNPSYHSTYQPPARTYNPPAHYSPPSRGTTYAPSQTYHAPSHSYSAPSYSSHSSSSGSSHSSGGSSHSSSSSGGSHSSGGHHR